MREEWCLQASWALVGMQFSSQHRIMLMYRWLDRFQGSISFKYGHSIEMDVKVNLYRSHPPQITPLLLTSCGSGTEEA